MGSNSNIFTFEDVAKHNNRQDCWLIVNGKVYDVTSYLDEHPGGDDALLSSTGEDATNDFEDVGHSKSARKLMEKYLVGEVDTSTLPKTANKFNSQPASTPASAPAQALDTNNQSAGFAVKILQFMLPLLILGLAFAMQYSGKESKSN